MNIGFVSTWFERGAAYVTKQYIKSVEENNNIFVYARGGERYALGDQEWDKSFVTWGTHLGTVDQISWKDFKKWIEKNKIEIIFFNEQRDIDILINIKLNFPKIKIGSYIDYYKQDTIDTFKIYDFLICNTKRHFNVFSWHPQCFYVKWGTDIDLYKLLGNNKVNDKVVFFHSAGMSTRKGTKKLIEIYSNSDLINNSKLIIHTQLDIKKFTDLTIKQLEKFNIEVIQKTVTAPGLYELGDVYIYPTELEGLGLTIYEAISCGLPVITTDNAPMNEVIDNNIGKLIDVDYKVCRADAYYWPISIINEKSLYNSMKYYIDNLKKLNEYKKYTREIAVKNYNWNDRKEEINNIFENTKILDDFSTNDLKNMKRKRIYKNYHRFLMNLDEIIKVEFINSSIFKIIKHFKDKHNK